MKQKKKKQIIIVLVVLNFIIIGFFSFLFFRSVDQKNLNDETISLNKKNDEQSLFIPPDEDESEQVTTNNEEIIDYDANEEPVTIDETNEPDEYAEPAEIDEQDEFIDIEDELDSDEDKIIDITTNDSELTNILNKIATRYNCAAISLAAFTIENGVYYTYQYGYADLTNRRQIDTDTKFRVASLSKITTMICAMVLVDDGLLDLDNDISIYLGYKVRNRHYPDIPITTRMLMQHTSSIFDSDAFQSSRNGNSTQSTQRILESNSPFRNRRPGSRHEYSNFGYAVLGNVCEMIAGESLDKLARRILFEPLDIDAAYIASSLSDVENIAVIYNANHIATNSVQRQMNIGESGLLGHDHHLAQGNLMISALDLTRVLAMLGNDGVLNDVRILSSNAVHEIHNSGDVKTSAYIQALGIRYKSGVFIPDEVSFWHTGSWEGTFTQVIYNSTIDRGIVVLTTGANTGRSSSGMIDICTELSSIVWEHLLSD